MTLYENTIRRSSFLDENEKLMEAYNKILEAKKAPMTVDEFMKELEKAIRKSFPKSYVNIQASTNIGASIHVVFAIGKDKSEWSNGIIQNDPMIHKFMIGFRQFSEGVFTSEKILAELSQGGTLMIMPEEGSYMAFGSVKLGWRKKTATPDKIVKHFENYFKKAKQILKNNEDNLDRKHYELIKKHI